jgi:hypothetical protein
MSDLPDFEADLERLDIELDNVGHDAVQEVYTSPHCSTCHFGLDGVAAKSHKKSCPGDDGHKMEECPHPIEKWVKSHHLAEVRLLAKRRRLLKAKAKAEEKVNASF